MNKETTLSDLLPIFQQLEIANDTESPNHHHLLVVDSTNLYKAEFYLRYPKLPGLDQQVLSVYIKDKLIREKHLVSDEIIVGILVLFSISSKQIRTATLVERFFSHICSLQLKQYLFFNGTSTENIPQLKFFDYTIGTLNYDKYENFLKAHTNSDYTKRYPRDKGKRTGIEVKTKTVQAIDIYQWITDCGLNPTKIPDHLQNLINIYFNGLSNERYKLFKQNFFQQQAFLTAYFGIIYTLKELEMIGISFINVFYGFFGNNSHGWLHTANHQMTGSTFPDARFVIPAGKFIEKNAELLANQNGAFARFLSIISEIFSRAEYNIMIKQYNHAFIDLFVGLDFLLAPDTQKSKKLKSRISMLVHGALNQTLPDQVQRLDALYDMRSDYVHNGVNIDLTDLSELRDISKILMAILLNLHKQYANDKKYGYEEWIKLVDHYYELFHNKGQTPNVVEQKRLGIYKLQGLMLTDDLIKLFSPEAYPTE